MKKYIYSALLSIVALFVTGCTSTDVQDVFSKPAAERIEDKKAEIQRVLTRAENETWLLEMYGDLTLRGGYALLLSFDEDGYVTAQAEYDVIQDPSKQVRSTYVITNGQGPILSFDTYNEIIHLFSDPLPPPPHDIRPGTGYGADMEFMILDVTENRIELQGRKHGHRLVMRRAVTDDKLGYLNDIYAMARIRDNWEKTQLMVGGFGMTVKEPDSNRILSFLSEEYGIEKSYEIPYCYTQDGLRFYEPVTILGETVQNFVFIEEENAFISTTPGTSARFQIAELYLNDRLSYGQQWYFSDENNGPAFLQYWDQARYSFTNNGLNFVFVMAYLGVTEQTEFREAFHFQFNDYHASFYYVFTPIFGSRDRLRLKYDNDNSTLAFSALAQIPGTKYFIDAVGDTRGKDYFLTTDDVRNPTWIQFDAIYPEASELELERIRPEGEMLQEIVDNGTRPLTLEETKILDRFQVLEKEKNDAENWYFRLVDDMYTFPR